MSKAGKPTRLTKATLEVQAAQREQVLAYIEEGYTDDQIIAILTRTEDTARLILNYARQ